MDIELYNGDAKAIISTHGGYVTNLANDDGDILFPKRTLRGADGSEKVRGGCHVCLPNFGPGGDSGLAQHGFGRTGEWVIASKSESAAELTLKGEGEYADMESLLRYELRQDALEMSLTLKNNGESGLKIAPGFHPYFAHSRTLPIVNSMPRPTLDEYAIARFIDGNVQYLTTAGRNLTLRSDQLTRWAVWTDQLGNYICVEPTFRGNAFVDGAVQPQTLGVNQEQSYSFTIDW